MSKTYSAFYIPAEETAVPEVNHTLVQQFTGWFNSANKTKSNNLRKNFASLAKNMNIQGGAELYQKYAAYAVRRIISGEKVTH